MGISCSRDEDVNQLTYQNIDNEVGNIECIVISDKMNMNKDSEVIKISPIFKNGTSGVIYDLGNGWLLKLPRNKGIESDIFNEYKALNDLSNLGINIPETYKCIVYDSEKKFRVRGLIKKYIQGYRLPEMITALCTTSIQGGECLHPECNLILERSINPLKLDKKTYKNIKRLAGCRMRSWMRQRKGGLNRRNLLQNSIIEELENIYKKIACDFIKMLETDYYYLFLDLKIENMIFTKENDIYKIYIIDVSYEYLDTKKHPKELNIDGWYLHYISSPWRVNTDETSPSECQGPYWNKWLPETDPYNYLI